MAGLTSGPETGYLSWDLPTRENYTYQATTKLSTEMVRLSQFDLYEKCGYDGKGLNATEDSECIVIFAVVASPPDNQTLKEMNLSSDPQDMNTLYNFAVYSNFMTLHPFEPAYGYVIKGNYQYFLYQETCSNCTIIFSISSYSSAGGLELYINKGMSRLPTSLDFDIHHSTLSSEILSLSLADTPFLSGLTSISDYYIIGVYSIANTTFQLTAASAAFQLV
jgi:hypothetical protein